MDRMLALCIVTFTTVLAGCLTPAPPPADEAGKADGQTHGEGGAETGWHLSAQRSLGFYARVQVPFASNTRPNPEYCPSLFLTVPEGSTRLDLNFTSTPLNTSNPSFGMQGFSARSESFETWVDYPGTLDQERWLDNPKRLSFDNPEPGKWEVYTYTFGAAYQQLGNLTIDLHGRSAAALESLDIHMQFNSRTEC
jgi:hypothetical protein